MLGTRSCTILAVRYTGSSRASLPRGGTLRGETEAAERFVPLLGLGKNARLTSPQSIYGRKFNDEKAGFDTKFKKGSLAMANSGKNSNSSQFFVVLTDDEPKLAKLDGKYVLFGQLRGGWEVLDALDAIGGGTDGKPTRPAWVGACGILL